MSQIELRNVNKTYGKNNCVIDNLNLRIPDGSFTVMVGPSGCGKSTTLRMIAGLESLSSGDLYIDGIRVNDMEPGERDIAMVFQNYALYPTMSVRGNIEFGLINAKVPKEERDRRIREICEIVGLVALSGTQTRRTVRRAAPESGTGTGNGKTAEGVPDGRAAFQLRCQAAKPDEDRAD